MTVALPWHVTENSNDPEASCRWPAASETATLAAIKPIRTGSQQSSTKSRSHRLRPRVSKRSLDNESVTSDAPAVSQKKEQASEGKVRKLLSCNVNLQFRGEAALAACHYRCDLA